ncbi:hypothetical protein AN902_08865 [Corynebacterium pseudotuberculosis]|nr:hypothetical protein AN902_08865 [Corynebacterium pseudotuberculosis]
MIKLRNHLWNSIDYVVHADDTDVAVGHESESAATANLVGNQANSAGLGGGHVRIGDHGVHIVE